MAITTAQFFVIGNAQKMATRVHILISLKLQKISFVKNQNHLPDFKQRGYIPFEDFYRKMLVVR